MALGVMAASCNPNADRASDAGAERALGAARDTPAPQNTVSAYIVPQPGEGINLAQTDRVRAFTRPQPISLYAAIPDSYVVSDAVNRNLDQDLTVEQVVFYKNTRGGDYIQLLVIDYDRRRDSYIRAWEGGTIAQRTTSLDTDFVDVTGDRNNEVLVYGRDQEGSFTLDVFAVQYASLEAIISLRKIGEFVSEVAIGVERGAAGTPARIVTEESIAPEGVAADIVAISEAIGDPENETDASSARDASPAQDTAAEGGATAEGDTTAEGTASLDTAASLGTAAPSELGAYQQAGEARLLTYRWSENAERFQRFSVPIVTNPQINQQFFQQLMQAPIVDLLQSIMGSWITDDNQRDVLLIIETATNTLSLQIEQRQIHFQWKGQFKTVIRGFPAIQLTLLNENITSINKLATITLLAADEIQVTIQDEPNLSRVYRRIDIEQSLEPPSFIDTSIALNGWYEGRINGERIRIYFYENTYILRHPAGESRGTFVLYRLDQPILELIALDRNRLFREHSQYLLNYQRRREDKQVVKALELIPIALDFGGYQPLEAETIQLLQMVTIRR